MSPRRANRRRAIGALVPLILTASLLSGDFVFAQNSPNLDEISLTAEQILPTARVAVLGDGLLSSPAIAPLQPNGCQTSTNGPVERAARRSPETVVLVQNESCVGASLSSIGSEQVGKLDPRTDVVVVGGVGIEFDGTGTSNGRQLVLCMALVDPSGAFDRS